MADKPRAAFSPILLGAAFLLSVPAFALAAPYGSGSYGDGGYGDGRPVVTTGTASSLASTSATLGGSISSIGSSTPTVRGFAYGTTAAYGATTTENGSFSTGSFSAAVSSLTCNTAYHFRAYAANATGTGYGDDATFTTSACDGGEDSGGSGSSRRSGGGGGGRVISSDDTPLIGGLTQAQADSILGLLRSFGADDATIANVDAALHGKATAGSAGGTASSYAFTRDLTLGSRGEDVRALQQYLNTHGFAVALSAEGSLGQETDYFGPATQAALARYQAANGIAPAAGYFGPLTRASVSGTAAPATPVQQPAASDPSGAFTRDLDIGSRGEDVRALQKYLNGHGYPVATSAEGSAGQETDYFGPSTQAALAKFQAASGITPSTGYFGPLTRAYIAAH
jgi:peptidoglycan hydrolase-like protein with peptidoglycan-binding domain